MEKLEGKRSEQVRASEVSEVQREGSVAWDCEAAKAGFRRRFWISSSSAASTGYQGRTGHTVAAGEQLETILLHNPAQHNLQLREQDKSMHGEGKLVHLSLFLWLETSFGRFKLIIPPLKSAKLTDYARNIRNWEVSQRGRSKRSAIQYNRYYPFRKYYVIE